MSDTKLESNIEALLFFKAEPVKISWLATSLEQDETAVQEALKNLEGQLTQRGIRLIALEDAVTLGTAPETASLIERVTKADREKELGKASLETLTIILYRGPVTKHDIDYIRGVNSNYMLRELLIRGLIEREKNPEDERGFIYRPTIDLVTYLGISKLSDLPEYEKVRQEILKFEKEFNNKEHESR